MQNRVFRKLALALFLTIAEIVDFTDNNPVFAQLTPDATVGKEVFRDNLRDFQDLIQGATTISKTMFHGIDWLLDQGANDFDYWAKRCDELTGQKQLEACERIIAIDANYTKAWYNRGLALANLKRYSEAIESYDRALAIDSRNNLAWYNRGLALANLERYSEAIESYDRALAIDANYTWAWNNRGLALANLKRYSEAIESYDRALAIDANYIWAWYNRGLALANLKRYSEAIESYDRALAIDANYTWAWYNRGLALANLKRYSEAIESYDRALAIDANYIWAWLIRVWTLANLERYSEAIESDDRAIAIDVNNTEAWLIRGLTLVLLDRYSEADRSFKRFFGDHINLIPLAKTVNNLFSSDRHQTESEMQITIAEPDKALIFNLQVKTIIQSPNLFRSEIILLESGEPVQKFILVSDGEKVWNYSPDLKQYAVTDYESFRESDDSPLIGLSSGLFLAVLGSSESEEASEDILGFFEAELSKKVEFFVIIAFYLLIANDNDDVVFKPSVQNVQGLEYYAYNFDVKRNQEEEAFKFNLVLEPTQATVKQIQIQIEIKEEGTDIEMAIQEKIIRQLDNPSISTDTFTFSPPKRAKLVDSLPILDFPVR
ncbi:MAG: tetratricopeptide repeat protein [Moorea sp. SIO2B7]|nr:tetratricopeptide repeat protein [Moorena sp. SIO2B7]